MQPLTRWAFHAARKIMWNDTPHVLQRNVKLVVIEVHKSNHRCTIFCLCFGISLVFTFIFYFPAQSRYGGGKICLHPVCSPPQPPQFSTWGVVVSFAPDMEQNRCLILHEQLRLHVYPVYWSSEEGTNNRNFHSSLRFYGVNNMTPRGCFPDSRMVLCRK